MKTDVIHKAFKWLDHNRYTAAGLAAASVVFTWAAACAPTTASLKDPGAQVTRPELEREVISIDGELNAERAAITAEAAALNAKIAAFNGRVEASTELAEAGFLDLDRQDKLRAEIVNLAGGALASAATGNPINLAALVTSGVSLLSAGGFVGTALDNRRKDRLIRTKKLTTPAATETA